LVYGKSTLRKLIALTGGPGGGKTTLIEELAQDPAWRETFVALPEAILFCRSKIKIHNEIPTTVYTRNERREHTPLERLGSRLGLRVKQL
jgi:tRNA uridine 5-carbamoylmethylation protein Kti12